MLNIEPMNKVLKRLIGKKLLNIFYQPTKGILSDCNMFVINFGERKIECSLHSFCFVRFRNSQSILLTSADEYFSPDYLKLDWEVFDKQEGFEKSLIPLRIKETKRLLKNAKVTDAHVESWGDIIVSFDNEIVMDISIDCSFEDYEYYRIIDCTSKDSIHYVVTYKNGVLQSEILGN